MATGNIQAAKEKLVDQILRNETYTNESGLYLRLRGLLLKMSKADLSSLSVLIACKTSRRLI